MTNVLKRLSCLSIVFSTVATDIPIQPQWPLKHGEHIQSTKVQTDICISGNPFKALLSHCGG